MPLRRHKKPVVLARRTYRAYGRTSRKLRRMPRCEDCDATGRFGSCEDLFHMLLALDHQRLTPWGPHHGLNVSCYYLQHPSTAPGNTAGGQWALVKAYRVGGLEAVNQIARKSVSQNRQGLFEPDDVTRVPARTHRPHFTIEHLSVNGTFPAQGYEERMTKWVSSVLSERTTESG